MSNSNYYAVGDQTVWTGRDDGITAERIYQTITSLDLQKTLPDVDQTQTNIALLGFASDAGVTRNQGRAGAKQGPQALRQCLTNLPTPAKNLRLFDAGDVHCVGDDLETAQQLLGDYVKRLLAHHITPIVLGGGHETAWGHYQGIVNHIERDDLGIINFDAHYDLRPLIDGQYGSSGTPFLQIAAARQHARLAFDYCCIGIQKTANTDSLFTTADDLNVLSILAEDILSEKNKRYLTSIDDFLDNHSQIYLSLCLDVFAQSVAPGVSAPQAFGLQVEHVLPLLKRCITSGKLLSIDIVELSPPLDQNQQTARLAAHLVWQLLHGLAKLMHAID